MRLYIHTEFTGHNPVGVAAIVLAPNRKRAAELLEEQLKLHGLEQTIDPKDFDRILKSSEGAIVLNDGDY